MQSGATGPTTSFTVDGRGLVIPGGPDGAAGGQRALGLAWMRYLQLTCQRFLSTGGALPEPLRAAWQRTVTLVSHAYTRNQKTLLGCFAAPTIGTPLQTLALREALPDFTMRIDAAFTNVTPHLLLELAMRRMIDRGDGGDGRGGARGDQITWPAAPSLATLAAGVQITPPEGTTALRFASGSLSAIDAQGGVTTLPLTAEALASDGAPVRTEGGFTVERKYFRAGGVTRLALLDHNPIAQFEAHPDKQGNPIGLGERDLAEWQRVLDEAFTLIERHQPGIYSEMGLLLHELIPVGYHAERHLSCSYREAIGTVYLTLHDNVMTMAEALVHEFQHNKINCAAWSADFLENAYEPHYKSPVRPDPRPLWGILLAVHAFLPVAQLYRDMREAGHPFATRPDWLRRLGEIDLKNHEGMEMLRANARWLPAGAAMFTELDRYDTRHMAERAAAGLGTQPTDVHLA